MPRFFFHLESEHEVVRDDEGVVADTSELAVRQAVEAVAEMLADGELPVASKVWTLVVRDEGDNELERIAL